jgi:hypothetical protein
MTNLSSVRRSNRANSIYSRRSPRIATMLATPHFILQESHLKQKKNESNANIDSNVNVDSNDDILFKRIRTRQPTRKMSPKRNGNSLKFKRIYADSDVNPDPKPLRSVLSTRNRDGVKLSNVWIRRSSRIASMYIDI